MQTETHLKKRINLEQTKREKLRKLLINYINFLIKCLNNVESKNEANWILEVIKALENKMWIQNHSSEDLSHISYLIEERKLYREIDNLYLP